MTDLGTSAAGAVAIWHPTDKRVWALDANGAVALFKDFDPAAGPAALLDFVSALGKGATVPVVVSGSSDWVQPALHAVPCKMDLQGTEIVQVDGANLYFLPAVQQAAPADVIHGQEATIAGFLSDDKEFDGVLCVVGAHTKWVHISAEEIVSFQSFMTGELADFVADKSSLNAAFGAGGFDSAAFEDAMSETLSRPERLASKMVEIQSAVMQGSLPERSARSRLLGFLIGAELGATRPYWLGQNVVVLADGEVGQAYLQALKSQGAMARLVGAEAFTVAGLKQALDRLKT